MNKLSILSLVVVFLAMHVQESDANTAVVAGMEFLRYTLDLKVTDYNETERNNICKKFTKSFKKLWYNSSGGKYLTEYLSFLEDWNCGTEFALQCSKRPYDFNQFTNTIYDRVCNRTLFETRCFPALTTASSSRGKNSTKWRNLLRDLRSIALTNSELQDPCIQVALYDGVVQERGKYGFYQESKRLVVPFCDISWCGRDAENVNRYPLRAWECLPYKCQVNFVIICVVCSIIALVTVVANLSVIFVYALNEKLRNSQGVYKISLACADFLVGAIVLPSFPISLSMQLNSLEQMGMEYPTSLNVTSDDRYDVVPHFPGSFEFFNRSYLNAIGFFTTTSFIVSIFTLMMASFDRFSLVRKPLAYSKDGAKAFATKASVALWILSLIIGILPVVIGPLKYGLVASTLISTSGTASLYLYAIAFALPLVVMWALSIATLVMTVKHSKRARKLVSSSQASASTKTEIRLARTLGIMVGVFTLSLVPVIIVLLVSLVLVEIYPSRIYTFNPQAFQTHTSFEFVCALILVCNSLWNFFIYNARNDDFRVANRSMYGTLSTKLREGSRRVSPSLAIPSLKNRRNTATSASIHSDSKKTSITDQSTSVAGTSKV